MPVENIMILGLTLDQFTAIISAVIAGIAVGWSRASNMRSKWAKDTAARANEQSLASQTGVNDSLKSLIEMQRQVGQMTLAISDLKTALDSKNQTISLLENKIAALEATVEILKAGEAQYVAQLAAMQVELDKANELIERSGLHKEPDSF